jgi:hypothetical protein
VDSGSFEFDVRRFPPTWWKIGRLVRSKETFVFFHVGIYDLDFDRKFLYGKVRSLSEVCLMEDIYSLYREECKDSSPQGAYLQHLASWALRILLANERIECSQHFPRGIRQGGWSVF